MWYKGNNSELNSNEMMIKYHKFKIYCFVKFDFTKLVEIMSSFPGMFKAQTLSWTCIPSIKDKKICKTKQKMVVDIKYAYSWMQQEEQNLNKRKV